MTRTELAMKLTGRQYRDEITKEEEELVRESGLLVLFGASDDLLEFRGVIYDETGAYDGTSVYVYKNKQGEIKFLEEEELNRLEDILEEFDVSINTYKIEANWCPSDNVSWTITTDLPHTTFNIMEDDDIYCVGIVIDSKDII